MMYLFALLSIYVVGVIAAYYFVKWLNRREIQAHSFEASLWTGSTFSLRVIDYFSLITALKWPVKLPSMYQSFRNRSEPIPLVPEADLIIHESDTVQLMVSSGAAVKSTKSVKRNEIT